LAALALGALFRFVWGGDIEYKQDEAWVYLLVTQHQEKGEWAELGMPSSQHLRVPALSVWVFYPFADLFGASEPTLLARGAQVGNCAALLLLALFAWRCVPAREREPWLWAVALLAVNPLTVLYHRKIWPPCQLPLFCVAFLVAWWYRDRRWGALTWGLVGACLGQVHVSGFLYAAAVLVATVVADRRFRWKAWLAGSVLGSLPMVPWLVYLARDRDPMGPKAFAFRRWIEGKFWTYWVTEPLGLDLRKPLGGQHAEFLRWPLIGGHPTWGGAALQLLTALLGALLIGGALRRWWRGRGQESAAPSSSALIVRAGSLGYGLLLTLAAVPIYRHYLIVTFPIMALWLARLALPQVSAARALASGRRLLFGLCAVNALSCAALLTYLHAHGGARTGDFGPTYAAQARQTGQWPPPVTLPEEAH
jgi:hypothetical protein